MRHEFSPPTPIKKTSFSIFRSSIPRSIKFLCSHSNIDIYNVVFSFILPKEYFSVLFHNHIMNDEVDF